MSSKCERRRVALSTLLNLLVFLSRHRHRTVRVANVQKERGAEKKNERETRHERKSERKLRRRSADDVDLSRTDFIQLDDEISAALQIP